MDSNDIIAALALPPESRVNKRVPKTLLLENGAPTAADKRQINEGIEDLVWFAALKPGNIGVPEYRDATREYLEIAILTLTLRPKARSGRLVELIHRAIPYPVFLVTNQVTALSLSLATKRSAQNEAGRVVLDDAPVACSPDSGPTSALFVQSLALSAQPRTDLQALYTGWIACFEAYQAAQITGQFDKTVDVPARRQALSDHTRLHREITVLRLRAKKEKQVSRRVELNTQLKQLEAQLDALKRSL